MDVSENDLKFLTVPHLQSIWVRFRFLYLHIKKLCVYIWVMLGVDTFFSEWNRNFQQMN